MNEWMNELNAKYKEYRTVYQKEHIFDAIMLMRLTGAWMFHDIIESHSLTESEGKKEKKDCSKIP